MELKFFFLIAIGIYLILVQPFEESIVVGAIAIAGGSFWLWIYSRNKSK